MQCPFCQQEMKSIDNGRPPPHLVMTWICKQCINEVRVLAEKNEETEQWIVEHTCIFVKHNSKEYCLHWDYVSNHFDIRDIATSAGKDSYLFRTSSLPHTLTPDNSLEKLKTWLIFL